MKPEVLLWKCLLDGGAYEPFSENATLIPQLKAAANVLPPQFLYELSRRLWDTDKQAAMEWSAVGKARALYDAQRCVDTTARQGILVLPMIAPDVMAGIEADRKSYGEAGLRALARPDVFLDMESPAWICIHGMGAVSAAIQNKPITEHDWLRPPAEWEGIKDELRKELTQYFLEQGRPQDDPIPMTSEKFSQRTLPLASDSANGWGWLNDQYLVLGNTERGDKGGPVHRLTMISIDGTREDIATTSGMWCVGNGVISYQTGSEKLSENARRITLAIGYPLIWSSGTRGLFAP